MANVIAIAIRHQHIPQRCGINLTEDMVGEQKDRNGLLRPLMLLEKLLLHFAVLKDTVLGQYWLVETDLA
ncbi:hypothetical protein H6F77_07885 [Microcoleus sp. FACHB-831]|nr:hypothetical protein [Microcoleus sp. FACHB-831]MBD1921007.1 hypothetical protein [Microcoleus sp. FACHB-831]